MMRPAGYEELYMAGTKIAFRAYCCILIFLLGCPGSPAATLAAGPAAEARQILSAGGVKGGLVVHIGCGDGRLTSQLRISDSYLVHGLDTSPESIARARERIRRIRQAIRQDPKNSAAVLAKRAGCSPSSINRHRQIMKRERMI